jgi:hypothetical protein
MGDRTAKELLDKARKLWNLKERAGTEGEALAATKALAKFVDKHRLEIATVEGLGAPTSETMAFEEDEPLMVYKRRTTWRYDLAGIFCEHYGVMFVLRSRVGGDKKIILAGRKTDIEMVRYMFRWLEPQVEMLAHQSGARGRTEKNSWRLGFVWGLNQQLKEAREEAVAGDPSGAMVLRCRAREAMNWMKEERGKELPQVVERGSIFCDGHWFGKGKEMGQTHHLGKSLEQCNATP